MFPGQTNIIGNPNEYHDGQRASKSTEPRSASIWRWLWIELDQSAPNTIRCLIVYWNGTAIAYQFCIGRGGDEMDAMELTSTGTC